MKLYTEEELLKAIQYGRDYYDGWVMTEPEILKLITPIELPSDEEIRQEGLSNFPNSEYVDRSNDRLAYYVGAKWMKEQILNQNK